VQVEIRLRLSAAEAPTSTMVLGPSAIRLGSYRYPRTAKVESKRQNGLRCQILLHAGPIAPPPRITRPKFGLGAALGQLGSYS
jgi:hypothetical protein